MVAYALTTLDHLKEVLGITTNTENTLLENIIDRSTDIIESYCNNRRFKSTVYANEEYDGTNTRFINAKQYPITAVISYQENNGTAGTPDWDDLQSDFVKYVDDGQGPGQFFYDIGFVRGIRNYRFSYTAGYTTIPYDLEEACLELCVWIYKDRQNKGMQSETLGEYSYTKVAFNGSPIETLGLDLVLEKYRTPAL